MVFKRKKIITILICIILILQINNINVLAKINDNNDFPVSNSKFSPGPFFTEESLEESINVNKGPQLIYQPTLKTSKWQEVEKSIYEQMKNRVGSINIVYTAAKSMEASEKLLLESINRILNSDHYIYYNMEYWLSNYTFDGRNFYIQLNVSYRTTKKQEEYVSSRVKEILSNIIKPGMTDRDKVKAIHDYIVLNVEYDLSYSRYTEYNALKDGKAVCQGYALLGHRMLNEAGIPTRILASMGMNHGWNLVYLDGQWYHMDMTWDDPVPDVQGRVLYICFLLTDNEIKTIGHFWRSDEYPTSGEGYNVSNKPTRGWYKESGKWYYIYNGIIQKGWTKVKNKWYYMDSSGVMQTGWKRINGKWYYMDSSGVMQTGWTKVGSKWYYMNSSGAMQIGWHKIDGKWYYMNSSGAMETGWTKVGGKWYYINSSGVMQTGWVKDSGKWYYLSSSGAMETGWTKVGSKWYYMNSGGVMQSGWIKVGSKWYYLYSDGSMAANTKIGGYKLGKDGAML